MAKLTIRRETTTTTVSIDEISLDLSVEELNGGDPCEVIIRHVETVAMELGISEEAAERLVLAHLA